MPSLNRKREREGGQDGARPSKRTSTVTSASASASASASNPASVAAAPKNSDPQILICPYDGHRRYDEWKGMMYGFLQVISGSGAMYPTNYQINFRHPEPWICPMANCRKCFQQSAQLGAHFSRAHRKLLLYDEACRGRFWAIGERKNPDKDGRFRSIVVKRGYYAPDDVRQPPEDWEAYVNPTAVKDINPPNLPQPAAAPSSTAPAAASASRPSTGPEVATSRPLAAPSASPAASPAIRRTAPGAGLVGRPTGNSIHEVIDISSDEEDVKPSLAELQRESNSATSGPQSLEAQRKAQSSGGNEADTQEDPFQHSPFLSGDPAEPVHNRNGSTQEPGSRQPLEPVNRAVDERRNLETSPIWTYMIKYSKTPTPFPDDAAISELLMQLPRRRDLPECWKGRLAAFDTLSISQLSALILYLGGTTPNTDTFQYCKVRPMKCHLRKGGTGCFDPNHNGGRCRTCGFTFPQCVFLPRYLLSSIAVAKRFGVWLCCNSFYRYMTGFPDGVHQSYTGKTEARKEKDGNSNTTPKEKQNNITSTNQPAHPHPQTSASRSNQSIAPLVSSTSTSLSNPAIQNKPRTTHHQPSQQASASSQTSSGTFCIPQNTPGQKPTLLDTPTKNKTPSGATSEKEKANAGAEGANSATKAQDNRDDTMDDDDSDPFDFDPFEYLPGNMPGLNGGNPRELTGTHQAGIHRPSTQQSSAQHSKNVPAIPIQEADSELPEIWRYMLEFLQPGTEIPDDAAITELLTLRKRRDLPKAWKFRLAVFKKHDLKTYTSVILYLGGTEAVTSPCSVMGCAHNQQTAEYAASLQRRDRVFVGYAFPTCVFLPRHLLDSVPIAKRLGRQICANSYYRKRTLNDQIQYTKEQALEAQGKVVKTTPGSQMAKSSPAQVPQIITPIVSSTTNSLSNLTNLNKPRTASQQRANKSQGSSGTFCIPEGTPGQLFSLKGTDTKLIQSSRNQILKCKVLAGHGVKVQLIGGKEFKAYKGWDDEWEIPPDSQCLVKNIHPKKSFGEDQTCIDVNPKKGVVKAGQAQGTMVKGKMV